MKSKQSKRKCPSPIEELLENDISHSKDFINALRNACDEDEVTEKFHDFSYIDEDDKDEREKYEQENQEALDELEANYIEVEDKIYGTKQGDPIYRGLIITDYRSFFNGLFHVGETLDRWIGKEPRKHEDAGIFWTWDKDCARVTGECDVRPSKDLVVLKGHVKPSDIDEEGTHNINFAYDNREREIRLKEGKYIMIDEICRHIGKDKKGYPKQVCEPFGKRVKV